MFAGASCPHRLVLHGAHLSIGGQHRQDVVGDYCIVAGSFATFVQEQSLLREQHLGRGSTDHELSDNLRPVLKAAQDDAFIQSFRHHDGVAGHQAGRVKADRQKAAMSLAAYRRPVGTNNERPAAVAAASGPTG